MKSFSGLMFFILTMFVFGSADVTSRGSAGPSTSAHYDDSLQPHDRIRGENGGVIARVYHGITGLVAGIFYWILGFFWSGSPSKNAKK